MDVVELGKNSIKNRGLKMINLKNNQAKNLVYGLSILFDLKKSDGALRKLMNCQQLENKGWTAKVNLFDGLLISYKDFLSQEVL